MTVRIVCIGNRFVPGDDLGPRVFDLLAARGVPEGVELVDGGLSGLDLCAVVETASRVVFVDALAGRFEPGPIELSPSEVDLEGAALEGFGHSGGLAYLLRALPIVCDAVPPWVVVGAGCAADPMLVERVAEHALAASAANKEAVS